MWKYLEISWNTQNEQHFIMFYNVLCFIHKWSISLADFLCCSFDWNSIPLNTAKFATSGFLLQGYGDAESLGGGAVQKHLPCGAFLVPQQPQRPQRSQRNVWCGHGHEETQWWVSSRESTHRGENHHMGIIEEWWSFGLSSFLEYKTKIHHIASIRQRIYHPQPDGESLKVAEARVLSERQLRRLWEDFQSWRQWLPGHRSSSVDGPGRIVRNQLILLKQCNIQGLSG